MSTIVRSARVDPPSARISAGAMRAVSADVTVVADVEIRA
jgi:hypothetical protein